MPLPKTKIFLSQTLAAGKSYLLDAQGAGDMPNAAESYVAPWASGIGDLNGDLIPDLLVGASGNDNAALDAGRAYVAFGRSEGGSAVTLGDPLSQFVVDGARAGDHAGASVARITDINLDGRADSLIGAPGVDNGSLLDAGAAYVVFGAAAAGALNLANLGTAGSGKGYLIKGQNAGDGVGRSIASIADQNGDGKADILIGAPGYDLPAKGGGGGGGGGGGVKEDAGAVYVVWGKSTDTVVDLTAVAAGTGGYRIVGEGTHDAIGSTVASIADTNGDGRADILIAAPSSGVGGADSGAVYVVFGKTTGTELSLKSLGTGGFRILGALGDKAGASVAGVGDLNGDGKAEILVGADNTDKVYVVFGKSSSTDVLLSDIEAGIGGFVIKAEAVGDFHGMSVAAGGDFNRDGRPDIVIGAPKNGEGGRDAGAVYVVWGGAGGIVDLALVAQGVGGAKIVGTAGSLTGSSVAALGDSNADGTPDLLIGSAGFGQESVSVLFAPATWQPDNNIYGTNAGDTIGLGYGTAPNVVGAGHDNVMGLAGNDSIATGAGDDDLDGGTGADALSGGTGNDNYWVDNLGDTTLEAAGEGTDTVYASINWTLADNVEVLQLEGSATQGSGNAQDNTLLASELGATLAGLGGRDTLRGGVGSDVLDGGTGDDLMVGGAGNDSYIVGEAGDLVQEAPGGGVDTLIASIELTLPAEIENLQLAGAAHRGTGNALNNTLTGGAGDDILDGGLGADVMAGGAGDDRFLVDNAGDSTVEFVGGGTDTVVASVDYTLGAGVEVLQLVGTARRGTGNAEANTLIGTAENDTLDGGAGADSLQGGAGNDSYRVDNAADVVVEAAGGGTDTVIASVDYTLGAEVEALQLTGAAHRGTGNSGDNTLTGGSGKDVLDGGAGADLMAGGLGDDTYLVDQLGDVVQEAAGAGTDTIVAPFSFAAVANVERLQVTGEGSVATGNDEDNTLLGAAGHQVLIGGLGNDSLDGGTGADTMDGGAGDDTYYVDDLGDLVIESAGGGNDTVVTAFDGTVAENIENVRLTGSAHTVTGNSGANRLSGNSGNDTLDGAGGDDLLLGGDGNDTLHSHSGHDTLSGGAGDDVYRIGHGGSVHIEDLLGHDLIDDSDSISDDSIDLSGDSVSHIEDEDVYITPGGSTAAPLDVQFLQDLSGSFGDDIANVRTLVPQIVAALRAVQANSLFGVSSFVDKGISPFGATGEWVYRMEQGLTADAALLSNTYNGMAINNGVDEPESQIESLMQLALRANEVGFRPDSARFVVLFTDAHYHQAGDGAAAGILTPNNGDAILDGGGIGEDYPLIPQVRAALEAANIIPVFAIAGGLTAVYDGLAAGLGRGVVVPLTADSSNVVAAINAGLTQATTTYIEDAHGGSGNDHLTGNVKDNELRGNGGKDVLAGGGGKDKLSGGAGDDSLDGGDDSDTAFFSGALTDYAITIAAGVTTVVDLRAGSPDGTDLLTNVETFSFADGSYSAASASPAAPVAVADSASGLIEAGGVGNASAGQPAATGNVLVNDSDANLAIPALAEVIHVAAVRAGAVADAAGAPVAGSTTVQGAMGVLTLQADGSYSYQLDDSLPATQALKAGQAGSDVFTYTVMDTQGLSSEASLTIQITGANDAPVVTETVLAPFVADVGVLVLNAAQLLAGAADIDGDTLTLSGLSASSGTLLDNGNGTWNFQPAAGDSSSVSFQFTVSDGTLSTPATATLDLLAGTAIAPETAAASGSGAEDGGAIAVLLGGSDADGSVATFRVTSVPANAALFADAALSTPLLAGELVAATAGAATVYLVPAANFNGSASFSYAAVDNQNVQDLTPAIATVTVTAVADAPLAVSDTLAATEDTAVIYTAAQLLGNDSDVDGDTLTLASVGAASGGTVSLNADGSVSFTPTTNFNGVAGFSYTSSDGLLASNTASVTVNVAAVNDAPVALADTLAATEDLAITYTAAQLLGNDSDVEGSLLGVGLLASVSGGSVVLNASGSVTFTPAADFNGAAVFTYIASDGRLLSERTSVTVNVAPVNDAPLAVADVLAATEDQSIAFTASQLLGNDSDAEGDAIAIASVGPAVGGTAVLNADGSVSFTPTANFNGAASFSYRGSDGLLVGNSATATVNVAAANDAPVAADDSGYTVGSGMLLASIPVLANDSDLDGDALQISGTPTALHGSVTVNADGTLNYTSNAGYMGDDTVSYSVSDGALSASASVAITVTLANNVPVVAGTAVLLAAAEDSVRVITAAELLASTSDADGDVLLIQNLSASSGTLSANADGSWTLVPVANDDSAVNFSFSVSDGVVVVAAAASLDLLPVNDAALISGLATGAVTEAATATGVSTASGSLSATDVDNAAAFSVRTNGSYGTLAINALGAWVYTLNNANATVNALNTGGPALIDTVTVQTTDGTTRAIDIAITGSDDVRTGTADRDTLTGTNGKDVISGQAGRDTLSGLDGDDTLDGGSDLDTMTGGRGDDIYVVDNAKDSVIENAGEGTDKVFAGLAWTLAANVENLVLTGSGAISGTGNTAANSITGNVGNNTLSGLAGNDILDGAAGADTLVGGAGADRFDFSALGELGSGTLRDKISDFSHADGDRINLSGLDADSAAVGDQAFAFIGGAAFTSHAGELRFALAGTVLTLQGDINGDGAADFQIDLAGVSTLVVADFML